MTIREAIDQTDALKPNQYAEYQKIGWLSELDGLIYNEIILTHENDGAEFEGYTSTTETTTALLADYPYNTLYLWFLESKIDIANGEIAKYNNSISMFNNAYQTYQNYYNRTHMPRMGATHFNL